MTSQQSETDLTSTLATVDQPPPPRRRSWLARLGRWLLALIILGGLGFGLYLLWPSIDERFVQPIADNSSDILNLTERVDDFEARIAELESRTAEIAESNRSDTTLQVEGELARLEAELEAQQARLEGLEETAFALADADAEAAARTEREVTVLRAMALMSRARLSLYQANYGLARDDLVAARGVLAELGRTDDTIAEVLDRLEASTAALPDLPVPAAADVDIAWELLLSDVSTTPGNGSAATTSSTGSETTTTTLESSTTVVSEPQG